MPHNLHDTLQSFKHGKYYSLPALAKALGLKIERLPVSIRIVLESVLRNCDGKKVTEEHVRQLAGWKPTGAAHRGDPVRRSRASCCRTSPACRCSATSPRCAAWRQKMGKDPKVIEPLVPVDLVVDHSVQIDHYAQQERARPEHEARVQA